MSTLLISAERVRILRAEIKKRDAEIERLRARVEKMLRCTITLEVMLKLFAKREELLAAVRDMREEAKP